MLRRIVLMLLSLSQLAERASGSCYPIRFLVLLILRPAFKIAYDYVGTPLPIPDPADIPLDNSRIGALRLAACFAVLAAVLQDELHEPPLFRQETCHPSHDAQPVVRCSHTPIGLPNSRAPPPLSGMGSRIAAKPRSIRLDGAEGVSTLAAAA